MGVICPLSPELRAINHKNDHLQKLIRQNLKGKEHYEFTRSVGQATRRLEPRYLYTEAILEDIEKLHALTKQPLPPKNINHTSSSIEDELKHSCLILQNQKLGKGGEEKEISFLNSESFLNNKEHNQSLVEQIGVLYKREIKVSEYSQALYVFLKWGNMFEEHLYGGFLKPLYRQFYRDIAKKDVTKFEVIIEEVQMFVEFMVQVTTEVYGLRQLASSSEGSLIKNDNVYNMIMCCLFKKTKLRKLVLTCVHYRDSVKIRQYDEQLVVLAKKPINFFGVGSKFTLLQNCSGTESEYTKSTDNGLYTTMPYCQSLKLVDQLCQQGTPITKLKTIILIAKKIDEQIRVYYQSKKRDVPELDPDNLAAILTYLLVRNGRKQIYEELKIAEHFSTQNSLYCVSGLYLTHFNSAIEEIVRMQEQ